MTTYTHRGKTITFNPERGTFEYEIGTTVKRSVSLAAAKLAIDKAHSDANFATFRALEPRPHSREMNEVEVIGVKVHKGARRYGDHDRWIVRTEGGTTTLGEIVRDTAENRALIAKWFAAKEHEDAEKKRLQALTSEARGAVPFEAPKED